MKDSVALKKIEDKNKQFLVEKIIHDVEFGNKKQIKSEMVETLESNYKVSRRVYQQLYYDIVELFHEYIQSIDLYEQQDIEEDLKTSGWGAVENIRTIKDSMRLMNIFQEFYVATGRLPTFNELLVVPDGDAPPNEKINLKHLYDLFKNTASHGFVSMPFLGLLFYYFHDEHKLELVKHATRELCKNLSHATLSGERPLEFQAISDLIGELSFSIKSFTVQNKRQREIEMKKIAKEINDGSIFNPVINDPLDDVVEIMDLPDPEHKKTTFSYVEPTVQLSDEIEETQKVIDDDYADLVNKIYGVNDVALTQKEQEKTRQVIEDVLEPSPFETQDNFWWQDEVFPKDDTKETIDTSKMIVDDTHNVDIQALSDNILKNLRPRDNRTIQELIDDDFIPLDDRTWQERMDDDNISLQSDNDAVTIEDVPDDEYTFNIRRPSTKTIPVLKIPNPEPNIVTVEPPVKLTNIPPTAPPKTLDVDIRVLSDNILKNLKLPQQQQQPRDNRNLQDLIDEEFIPLDDRDPAEIVKDKNEIETRRFPIITLTTPDDPVIQIDATDAWDENKTQIQKPGPIYRLSTDYEKKVRAANKIKNKYLRKKVGQRKHVNKISAEWLKTAGYLDTEDQDKINYIFVTPKKKSRK